MVEYWTSTQPALMMPRRACSTWLRKRIAPLTRDSLTGFSLASAGIPGAFPFRMIDQELYVDGGVTGNIQDGGRRGEENTIPAIWQKLSPELPIPKIRMWVIFNNQFRPVPEVTVPNWVAVIQRSLDTASRA